jgi:hypothetical protein
MTKVDTIQGLCDMVSSSIAALNKIIIEDVEADFDIDFRKILRECNICHFEDENTICIVKLPIHISNIVARKLSFVNIHFHEDVYIGGIYNSNITGVYFCSCKFLSEKKYSIILDICDWLQMTDCYSKSSIHINSINKTQSINIDDFICDKNLEFWNLKLISNNFNNKAEAYIQGDVKNEVLFFNSSIVNGNIIINCNCRKLNFFGINYKFEEKKFLDIYSGTINTSEVEIELINLCYCKIHTIDIHNSIVSNIHECQFFCKKLEDETSMAFRNAALQNNNDILVSKYTSILYDAYLRSMSVDKYNRCIEYISFNKPIRKQTYWRTIKRILYKYIYEPIILLIPNIFSSEGLLLWLNKYSNNYNRSWIRGVIFTLLTTLFFYFIINYCGTETQYFIIDFRLHNFREVLEGYLSLLDIFNLSSTPQSMQLNIYGKILLFFAKISIGYGSWQTIYAFYKYKR